MKKNIEENQFFLQSKDAIDVLVLWKLLLYGAGAMSIIFVTCELGQWLTNAFEVVDYEFEQLN